MSIEPEHCCKYIYFEKENQSLNDFKEQFEKSFSRIILYLINVFIELKLCHPSLSFYIYIYISNNNLI